MKRVFYIANSYDGSYFVLCDTLDEYSQRLSAYALNLKNSRKMNHYSFGSVEMTSNEYLEQREKCSTFEKERIQIQKEPTPVDGPSQKAPKPSLPDGDADNVIQLFQ